MTQTLYAHMNKRKKIFLKEARRPETLAFLLTGL
jgi:hypothetical protein